MVKISYKELKVLIADDFSSFRSTVSKMLLDLGLEHVDMAANAEEVIDHCEHSQYDVVLCDYNLGSGRNGQHVLEELRFRELLKPPSIFILVSAESSRNIVMSAYDSAPDDYLMKPITTKMLQNRLNRLLQQRLVMEPVFRALEKGDQQVAIDLLIDLSIAEDRHSSAAQKMLGEMFLNTQAYAKAEKLYMSVLEVRELDWARLGLAKAKHLQGECEQAGKWLEKIIFENYLYLPAYDVLSENFIQQGETISAQEIVQQAVEVSPMSILRQKNLASLALKNNDTEKAMDAMRKVLKLGKYSCHGNAQDKVLFVRCVAAALEEDLNVPSAVWHESNEIVNISEQASFEGSVGERVSLHYINSRLRAARGETELARDLLGEGESLLLIEDTDIDIEIDHIRALLALSDQAKVTDLLVRLQTLYADDQAALEKLDEFLDEPASDANKAMVAEVNREGIHLYNEGRFEEALLCFDDAMRLFPKHIGLQLNVIQALVGKRRANPEDLESMSECRALLESISRDIDEDNPQYKRFTQLKGMAKSLM